MQIGNEHKAVTMESLNRPKKIEVAAPATPEVAEVEVERRELQTA
jgi:hypothetical protein